MFSPTTTGDIHLHVLFWDSQVLGLKVVVYLRVTLSSSSPDLNHFFGTLSELPSFTLQYLRAST